MLSNNSLSFFYKGKSMAGTFKLGDRLLITALPMEEIRTGDVLLYKRKNSKGTEEYIAHRVMKILHEGVIVKGDANRRPDRQLVTAENIVGKASHVIRNGKIAQVRGAAIGSSRAGVIHQWAAIRLWVKRRLRQVGRKPYAWFRHTRFVSRIWRPEIKKIQIKTHQGPLVKYRVNDRTVAECWPQNGRFLCRKPYDLILWALIEEDLAIGRYTLPERGGCCPKEADALSLIRPTRKGGFSL